MNERSFFLLVIEDQLQRDQSGWDDHNQPCEGVGEIGVPLHGF